MFDIAQFKEALGNDFIEVDDLQFYSEAAYVVVNYEQGRYNYGKTKTPEGTFKSLMKQFYKEGKTVKNSLLYGADRNSVRIVFFNPDISVAKVFPFLRETVHIGEATRKVDRSQLGYLWKITHKDTDISMLCFRNETVTMPAPVSAFQGFFRWNIEKHLKVNTASEKLAELYFDFKASDFTVTKLDNLTSFSEVFDTLRATNANNAVKAITLNV